jgi:hypothetical protein
VDILGSWGQWLIARKENSTHDQTSSAAYIGAQTNAISLGGCRGFTLRHAKQASAFFKSPPQDNENRGQTLKSSGRRKIFLGIPTSPKNELQNTIDLFSFRAPTEILIYELFTVP